MASHPIERRLVLWDIDHTLIETRGLGRQLYRQAFEAVARRPLAREVDPTGRTELAIFAETLELNGIEANADIQRRYIAELTRQYEANLDELRIRGRILPGATEALAALANLAGPVQTVLTGNLRGVAAVKLRAFGLARYIDLDAGAYGEDDAERSKLVPFAQDRAGRRYGVSFNRDNTIIIGDTVSDVRAAHSGGAAIVAIASGHDNEDELREAGAEIVLPDLTDTDRIIEALDTRKGPDH
ncbi:haloacid dehalogenase-like hydrolase [Actinomycetes bacterium KLBMP 9797]